MSEEAHRYWTISAKISCSIIFYLVAHVDAASRFLVRVSGRYARSCQTSTPRPCQLSSFCSSFSHSNFLAITWGLFIDLDLKRTCEAVISIASDSESLWAPLRAFTDRYASVAKATVVRARDLRGSVAPVHLYCSWGAHSCSARAARRGPRRRRVYRVSARSQRGRDACGGRRGLGRAWADRQRAIENVLRRYFRSLSSDIFYFRHRVRGSKASCMLT